MGRNLATTRSHVAPYINLLRYPHWCKNLLLFVPLLTANQLHDVSKIILCLTGFLSFSLVSSSGYIFNDILDIEYDRAHPIKKDRPIASSMVSINLAYVYATGLLVFATTLALKINLDFAIACIGYFILTISYSLFVKKVFLGDVIVLAILFTMRIIAGGFATGVYISPWLIGFSLALFLSLAIVKRVSEFRFYQHAAHTQNNGRAYLQKHIRLLIILGYLSSLVAITIFIGYINSNEARIIYQHPQYLWGVFCIITIWLIRLWRLTINGQINDDPVVFALTDRVSLFAGILIIAIILWSQ